MVENVYLMDTRYHVKQYRMIARTRKSSSTFEMLELGIRMATPVFDEVLRSIWKRLNESFNSDARRPRGTIISFVLLHVVTWLTTRSMPILFGTATMKAQFETLKWLCAALQ